jgi:hypothetical protein
MSSPWHLSAENQKQQKTANYQWVTAYLFFPALHPRAVAFLPGGKYVMTGRRSVSITRQTGQLLSVHRASARFTRNHSKSGEKHD